MRTIRKVAVIGAGTMGGGIAAHFANAGVPCLLLDIVPPDLGEDEKTKPSARSKLARNAIAKANKGRLKGFHDDSLVSLVEPGNIEDDLGKLESCDWIVEAVTERIDLKKDVYKKIAPHRREDAIISSNTSGISLNILTEEMDSAFRKHFLITHFFNPPRHLYLLETVAGPETLPDVIETVEHFADVRLGKGVVRCKDTPNFIGNRIGVHAMAVCGHLTEEFELSFEDVDAITGRPLGRPKSASYILQDIVGIDVSVFVMENVAKLLPDDESLDIFKPAGFFTRLVEEGRLGRKTGAGFYRKEGKEILVLDRETFEYRPQEKSAFESLALARGEKSVGERIKRIISHDDVAGQFAWKLLAGTLCYSAQRIPEISHDIVAIDHAMRWGFAWELGPFETWDAIGVGESVDRMQAEGMDVPAVVTDMLASGQKNFYGRDNHTRSYFDFETSSEKPVPARDGVLLLGAYKASETKPVRSSEAANVWDIGDGVLCVEFQSKMNTIDDRTLDTIIDAIDEAESGNWAGIVIGNQAEHFCAGANLAKLAEAAKENRFGDIEAMIGRFHRTALRIRYSTKPVVVTTQGFALGGGCEIPLASQHVQAYAETYMGLVELGVGLIPAGGGTRELACRAHEAVPTSVPADIFPFVRRAFEIVGKAAVSSSAEEARSFGYLRESDGITMNRDRALNDAKRVVIAKAELGYRPPPERRAVRVVGRGGLAEFKSAIYQWREAKFISEYDAYLGEKLAYVLCGGDVDDTVTVSEDYLLGLERQVFLELCGQPKTHERIEHMLKTGKPLRN